MCRIETSPRTRSRLRCQGFIGVIIPHASDFLRVGRAARCPRLYDERTQEPSKRGLLVFYLTYSSRGRGQGYARITSIPEVDNFRGSRAGPSVGTQQPALYFEARTWNQLMHLIARDWRGAARPSKRVPTRPISTAYIDISGPTWFDVSATWRRRW